MRKVFPVFLALGACAALASPARAANLAPGATVAPTTLSSFQVGGSGADATVLTPSASGDRNFIDIINNQGQTVATLRQEVVRDTATGKLDFLYQISRTGGGDITAFTITGFAGNSTDVNQVQNVTRAANGGGIAFASGTTSVSTDTRSAFPGDAITFDLSAALASGKSTYTQIVKTNAVAYDTTGTATLSPSGLSVTGVFTPVPVPEPGTLALWGGVGAGLLGLLVWNRRRRAAPTGPVG